VRFVPLVLRSLSRNRRRTLLTIAGIALSVFVSSALLAVEGGFETLFDSSERSLLNVSEKGLACPLSSRVYDSYLRTVAAVPHVVAATGVLRGLYSYQTHDKLVVVSGVDYDSFRKLKSIVVRDGSAKTFVATGDGALVGRRVAGDYGWHVGQTVALLEDRLRFRVSGIFESPDKAYEGGVLVHKEFLARLKRDEGRSTFLVVSVDDPGAIGSVSGGIDRALANHPKPTRTLSERAAKERELKDFLEIRRMLSVMLLATILTSVFGAANSVAMSVRERTREVGILRSVGLRKGQILGLLVGESTVVAAVGGVIGLLAALALVLSAAAIGGLVPLVLGPKQALLGLAIALSVGVLGAILPSLRASRSRIIESLRFVD
jgi:putative ABC transport system permease protein